MIRGAGILPAVSRASWFSSSAPASCRRFSARRSESNSPAGRQRASIRPTTPRRARHEAAFRRVWRKSKNSRSGDQPHNSRKNAPKKVEGATRFSACRAL